MNNNTLKLFKVTIKLSPSLTGTHYNYAYVVARDMNTAYKIYRDFLDKEDIEHNDGRELESIELIAENYRYPECGRLLFVEDNIKLENNNE